MFKNSVMPLIMVSHEEPRKVYDYDKKTNQKIEDSFVTKTRCLFLRTYDPSWDTKNEDGTYPYCHACVVDLPESIFKLVQPKVEYQFACDISEDNFHRSTISPRKVKVGNQIYDIKTEDAVSIESAD